MVNPNPRVNLTIVNAQQKIVTGERRPLLFAQGVSTGSYTSGELITNLSNDDDELKALLGSNSQAYIMATAFRELNEISRLDAIIVDDNGSGVDAEGIITITGAPTEDGSITVSAGSLINNSYTVATTTTSTPTTIGDDLAALINNNALSPVTAANVAGVVTLTTVNAGTEGNRIPLQVVSSIAGLNLALTAFSGGAVDPVVTGVLDKLDDERYDLFTPIAFLSAIKSHLNPKFNTDNQVVDGIGFVSITDTFSNHLTALASESSQNIVYIANKILAEDTIKGSVLQELDSVVTSHMTALRAKRFVANANISTFMQSGNTRGGAKLASIPYFSMIFSNLPAIPETKNFTGIQLSQLRNAGATTFSMDGARVDVLSNEVMLTSFDAANPTPTGLTFKFLNDNDTLTTAREYIFTNIKTRFAQAALYDGDIPANTVGVNQEVMRSFLLELWTDLTGPAFGVLQGGLANQQDFLDSVVINIDTANGIISGSFSLRRTAQAREFTFTITPIL